MHLNHSLCIRIFIINDIVVAKYDKEKYREMLLEAAETVLVYFGFDKTVYDGDIRKNRNRKWSNELQEE